MATGKEFQFDTSGGGSVQTTVMHNSFLNDSENANIIRDPRLILRQSLEQSKDFGSHSQISPNVNHSLSSAQENFTLVKERSNKRKAEKSVHDLHISRKTEKLPLLTTQNSFDALSDNSDMEDETTPREPTPPPIYIPSVKDIKLLLNIIDSNGVNKLDYTYKILNRNQLKLNANSGQTYSAIVKNLRTSNIDFHTFQLKQHRAFRVVLRHIHHSMDVSEIKHELGEKGHKVRNICNILNRLTKEPLSLFYVDLEPAPNNKDIYKIDRIQNAKIQFEPPHTKRDIPQCKRCQRYGHTRAYCFRPFRCVKCGENHDTAMCLKQNGVAVKCALCDGSHPANYKGCGVYQEIRRD